MKKPFWKPIYILILCILLGACANAVQPADLKNQPIYIPPSPQKPIMRTPVNPKLMIATPTVTCTNSLHFIADITIPDGSILKAGSELDKVWEVENDGTCNWDNRYRIKWIGGADLGVPHEMALYPARSGTHTQIRIHFIAPKDAGTYHSAWQAFDPQDQPFGDLIYIEFVVSGD